MKRVAVALTIAALLSSVPVLAQQGGPPENPGGVCDIVESLPLPSVVTIAEPRNVSPSPLPDASQAALA